MTTRRTQRSPSAHRRRTAVAAPGDIFRLEGEYWTIVYQGALCRLRDAKGLRYLAHLLLHPGRRFSATGLAAACDYGTRNADCGLDSDGASAIHNPKSTMDERARLAVTKRIKAAVQKIEQHHTALGLHLIATIKTGYQCAYLPDPHDPISWSV
ncbi:MAG TPA: hypothetical protein VMW56_07545 [Candidatus Margulisiibacteriota bacterium]|nr:hypothetical protein [Candidatus Margulisiibacteriota bacterium]